MECSWLEISIDTTAQGLEELSAYLTAAGVTGLVLDDEADFQDFLENNHDYWDYVDDELLEQKRGVSRVTFYLMHNEDGQARLAEITAGLPGFRSRCPVDAGTLTLHTTAVQEEDWSNNWKQYYKPLTVGKTLRIIPEWMREEPVLSGQTPIYLNPGLIFGTGSHASTQLCLEALEGIVTPGCRVLDLGCGSGILAIAALCMGAAEAVGCDIDPKAVGVAMENAAFNGITEATMHVYAGNILSDQALQQQLAGQYDMVLANIVADVIIPLSAVVRQYLVPEGYFLCSGIIDSRAEEVEAVLQQNGFRILGKYNRSSWYCFLCQ